ncbi:hypothetical protein RJ641_015811 [Dillenia turbinata]|uniref:Uncharacterized protein n=1 Tax=Dillenia turbinata TaxID=194707 RepID=A0AAN8Z0K2_9MAGN
MVSRTSKGYLQDRRSCLSLNVSSNGVNDFPGFKSTPPLILGLIRTTVDSLYLFCGFVEIEENEESTGDANGKCICLELISSALAFAGYGLTNNGILFTGYPVVGYQNKLQASGRCLDSLEDALIIACPWDPRAKEAYDPDGFFSSDWTDQVLGMKDSLENVKDGFTLEWL